MNFSTALENRNFSSRTIVKRTMLPAEISVESCLLLAELLTRSLSRQKKRISAYAGGRITHILSLLTMLLSFFPHSFKPRQAV